MCNHLRDAHVCAHLIFHCNAACVAILHVCVCAFVLSPANVCYVSWCSHEIVCAVFSCLCARMCACMCACIYTLQCHNPIFVCSRVCFHVLQLYCVVIPIFQRRSSARCVPVRMYTHVACHIRVTFSLRHIMAWLA